MSRTAWAEGGDGDGIAYASFTDQKAKSGLTRLAPVGASDEMLIGFEGLTRDERRRSVGIATDDYDADLATLTEAAKETVTGMLGYPPDAVVRTDYFDGFAVELILSAPPREVLSVSYSRGGGGVVVLPFSAYSVRATGGVRKHIHIPKPPTSDDVNVRYRLGVPAGLVKVALRRLVSTNFRRLSGQQIAPAQQVEREVAASLRRWRIRHRPAIIGG